MSWLITPSTKVAVDPFRSQVSLLLHGDGANGSTIITDNSPSPKTVTAVGNAQISTAQSKFGGASIAFDGNNDFVYTNTSSEFAFGTQDFTIEGWFYFSALTANTRIWTFSNDADNLDIGSSNRVAYYNGSTQTFSANNTLSLNSWLHIALVRLAGTAAVYVNGISVMTQAVTPNTSTARFVGLGGIGNQPLTLSGYIDEFRISRLARYTANFTPPTAPFPDI